MNIELSIVVSIFVTAVLILVFSIPESKQRAEEDKSTTISFKETLELVEVPLVTFKSIGINGKPVKINLIIDTGACTCYIDENVAKSLKNITYTDKTENIIVGSGEVIKGKVGSLEFYYENSIFVNKFMIVDFSETIKQIKEDTGITIAGYIGSDFFDVSRSVISFDKKVIKINKRWNV